MDKEEKITRNITLQELCEDMRENGYFKDVEETLNNLKDLYFKCLGKMFEIDLFKRDIEDINDSLDLLRKRIKNVEKSKKKKKNIKKKNKKETLWGYFDNN